MASENETVEDIVKEMHRLSRATNRNGLNVKDDPLRTVRKSASAAVHMFANRIEAAHKRENAELQRRLKVADDALAKISKDDLCGHREQAARALSDIRA